MPSNVPIAAWADKNSRHGIGFRINTTTNGFPLRTRERLSGKSLLPWRKSKMLREKSLLRQGNRHQPRSVSALKKLGRRHNDSGAQPRAAPADTLRLREIDARRLAAASSRYALGVLFERRSRPARMIRASNRSVWLTSAAL